MKMSTLIALAAELNKAREKYPDPSFLTLALAEESGEAVKAALDYREGKSTTPEDLRKECIQTAAMAIRLLEEGDPALFAPPLMAELVHSEEPAMEIRVVVPANGDHPETNCDALNPMFFKEAPVPTLATPIEGPAPSTHAISASKFGKVGQ